nr:helix-turn-helix domain-containing protein [Limosilactobacillus fermentum]
MSSYNHLTLKDRECILLGVTLKDTYQVIAQRVGCSKATVSREIKRNGGRKAYSGSSPKCWCKLNSANLSFHKLKHTGFF